MPALIRSNFLLNYSATPLNCINATGLSLLLACGLLAHSPAKAAMVYFEDFTTEPGHMTGAGADFGGGASPLAPGQWIVRGNGNDFNPAAGVIDFRTSTSQSSGAVIEAVWRRSEIRWTAGVAT